MTHLSIIHGVSLQGCYADHSDQMVYIIDDFGNAVEPNIQTEWLAYGNIQDIKGTS